MAVFSIGWVIIKMIINEPSSKEVKSPSGAWYLHVYGLFHDSNINSTAYSSLQQEQLIRASDTDTDQNAFSENGTCLHAVTFILSSYECLCEIQVTIIFFPKKRHT